MGAPKKTHDATRAERKAKKRKLEDAVPDLPGDEGDVEIGLKRRRRDSEGGAVKDAGIGEEKKQEKKRRWKEGAAKGDGEQLADDVVAGETEDKEKRSKKKSKKTKQSKSQPESTSRDQEMEQEREQEPAAELGNAAAEGDNVVVQKKSKKERKAERRSAKEAAKVVRNTDSPAAVELSSKSNPSTKTNGDTAAATAVNADKKPNPKGDKKRKAAASSGEEVDTTTSTTTTTTTGKPSRFIVFVGNLPFTATTPSIQAHFASVKPSSIRHLTQRDDPAAKSKGCAFVEFDGYDHMKTCLKLFHHSLFDDGVSPARKINVELTAGGGGNTKTRREKIVGKNQKLNEERTRRIHEEEKAKVLKSAGGANSKNEAAGIDESAIHPSRRTRVPVAV